LKKPAEQKNEKTKKGLLFFFGMMTQRSRHHFTPLQPSFEDFSISKLFALQGNKVIPKLFDFVVFDINFCKVYILYGVRSAT
jgi:hypothetical protein